ncbi:MAG: DUF885 domain-containing protein, partial [Chloroflexi bacterium]|nr:DUF885 domain-containing protein [Chloroflexota bacterium]
MKDDSGRTPVGTVAAAYWETFLETNPLFATSLGEARFDDRLPDRSAAGIAAVRTRYAGLIGDAEALDGGAFGDEDRVTHDALREAVAADLANLDAGLAEWNVDPLDGVPVDLLNVPDYQRLETPADGSHMVARWRGMAVYTDDHLASLRRSLADGRVACRAPAERTTAILAEILGTPTEEWPLLAPLAVLDALPGWTTAERERFAAGLRDAVDLEIRPAFARLHDALVTEILPASRPADRPGMCHL